MMMELSMIAICTAVAMRRTCAQNLPKDCEFFSPPDGHLLDVRHQVIRKAFRIFADASTLVIPDWIEVPQYHCGRCWIRFGVVTQNVLDEELRPTCQSMCVIYVYASTEKRIVIVLSCQSLETRVHALGTKWHAIPYCCGCIPYGFVAPSFDSSLTGTCISQQHHNSFKQSRLVSALRHFAHVLIRSEDLFTPYTKTNKHTRTKREVIMLMDSTGEHHACM